MDIRLHLAFRNNPKVHRLELSLGAEGVLSLITLWCWTAEHKPKGRLDNLSHGEVESFAQWRGESQKFISECLKLNLLSADSKGVLSIHDWSVHQPWVFNSDKRKKIAKANAVKGWKGKKKDADGMPAASNPHSNPHAGGNATSYAPFLSFPYPTQPTDMPSGLQTASFAKTWDAWQAHRKELKKKLTPTAAGRQIKELAAWGEKKAIVALEKSMRNGWTGIFEPDAKDMPAEKPEEAEPDWDWIGEMEEKHREHSA